MPPVFLVASQEMRQAGIRVLSNNTKQMNIATLRGRIMAPDYLDLRFRQMEREADAYWDDWKASQRNEDIHLSRRYRRKALYYLKKMDLK